MSNNIKQVKLSRLFKVKSGDFHAVSELSSGETPLISCGDTNNGCVGFFDIPQERVYKNVLTVAYNGSWPLMAKYHPYVFGAKDDVAVLIPTQHMRESTLLYIATLLNNSTWRYNYGRKCFRTKLSNVLLPLPIKDNTEDEIDEDFIDTFVKGQVVKYIPSKTIVTSLNTPTIKWSYCSISDIFDLYRGDFHSISALALGEYVTVSRTSTDNGVVGRYELPDNANVYQPGILTISTVGGDAFVQLDNFIATDNVVVCVPKQHIKYTTMFFIAFMLNQQKWRYSYGRQCYLTKLSRVKVYLPVLDNNTLDEEAMGIIVEQSPYWANIKQRFVSDTLTVTSKPIKSDYEEVEYQSEDEVQDVESDEIVDLSQLTLDL